MDQTGRRMMQAMDNAHLLNGFVDRDSASIAGSDVSVTDIEYEFIYSISDQGDEDRIIYGFDSYPSFEKWTGSSDGHGLTKTSRDTQKSTTRKLSAQSKQSSVSFADSANDQVKFRHQEQANSTVKSKQINNFPHQRKTSVDRRQIVRDKTELPEKQKQNGSGRKPSALSEAGSAFSSGNKSYGDCSADGQNSKISVAKPCDRDTNDENQKINQRKKSVSFDPALEKASAYLHSGGKNFSRANTTLTPVRFGLKHLQMNYTETNLETNDSVIFLDLLKTSHQRNYIRGTSIKNIESRLELKRKNPHYFTSFYEHKKLPDPLMRDLKKNARSVAQKKLERKKKIKSTTDEMLTGYVPTVLTMKIPEQDEVEDIGRSCRYLRCKAPPLPSVTKVNKSYIEGT